MADGTRLTVGSLVGLPMGVVREQSAAPAPPASPAIEEQEGPGWRVTAGMVTRDGGAAWRADGIEALTFNNPFGQVMERVWSVAHAPLALMCCTPRTSLPGRVDSSLEILEQRQDLRVGKRQDLRQDDAGDSLAGLDPVIGVRQAGPG